MIGNSIERRCTYSPEQRRDGIPLKIAQLNYHAKLAEQEYEEQIGDRTVLLDEDTLPDDGSFIAPEDAVNKRDLADTLKNAIENSGLSRRQKQVMEIRLQSPDVTNVEIAAQLGISSFYIGQLVNIAEFKIRRNSRQTGLKDFWG